MANKSGKKTIEYGTDKCYIYPIVDGIHTEGFRQLGMRAFTREVEQEDTILYADNAAYITVPGNKTVSGELTYYKINDEFWELLGWEIQENGVIADSGNKSPFGMAFITQEVDSDGANDPRLVVCPYFYGTEPSREKSTLEDTVEGEELVVAYTASTFEGFTAESGNLPTMFIVTLEGWTVAQAEELLSNGISLPTDDFTLPGSSLVVSATTTTFTETEIAGVADVDALTTLLGTTVEGGTVPYTIEYLLNGDPLTYPWSPTEEIYDITINATDSELVTGTTSVSVTVTAEATNIPASFDVVTSDITDTTATATYTVTKNDDTNTYIYAREVANPSPLIEVVGADSVVYDTPTPINLTGLTPETEYEYVGVSILTVDGLKNVVGDGFTTTA